MASQQLWVVDTFAWIEWLTDSQHGKNSTTDFLQKTFVLCQRSYNWSYLSG